MKVSTSAKGLEQFSKRFGRDLSPALRSASTGLAHEAIDRIAPYPQERTRQGRQWYERGYGQRWQRKDGGVGGRKTSETLGRRWDVKVGRVWASAINTASYSRLVHKHGEQARIHKKTGWKTDRDVIKSLKADGTAVDLLKQALKATWGIS